jgi:hypothetical protein
MATLERAKLHIAVEYGESDVMATGYTFASLIAALHF